MADTLLLRLVDPPADPTGPLLVDARRLAELLGVSVRTVRAWDVAGRLPAPLRIGASVRWRLDEIQAWVGASCPRRAVWTRRQASRRQ